jgi:hypothetical protein
MTKWEYCLANLAVVAEKGVPAEHRLGEALTTIEVQRDEMGVDGWEAVGPITVSSLYGSDQQHTTVLLLKRPIQEAGDAAQPATAEPQDAVPWQFTSPQARANR